MSLAQSIQMFAFTQPKLFLAVIIIATLIIMIKSADMLLFGVTRYFHRIGLSDYLTGLIVVAAVASFPELISSITGASLGDHGVVFGAILGSNVGGLTLILGIMALITKKVNIQSKLFTKVRMLVFFITLLPLFLVIDGTLSRIDGAILILGYIAYVVYLWKKQEGGQTGLKNAKFEVLWKDGLIFIFALGALLLSARWLIFGVIELSRRLEISSFIVSVVILGISAQIPDLIVIIRSEMSGHKDVGMGDLLGSTITKQLLFFGMIAVATPLSISFGTILLTSIAFASTMALVLVYMKTGWVTWKQGLFLLGVYCVYLILEIVINAA